MIRERVFTLRLQKSVPEGDTVEEEKGKERPDELFNFGCVLRGEVKHLEMIKGYIVTEYVNTGRVKMINPTYEKIKVYILTDEQWKEYQMLKSKDPTLIGVGFL